MAEIGIGRGTSKLEGNFLSRMKIKSNRQTGPSAASALADTGVSSIAPRASGRLRVDRGLGVQLLAGLLLAGLLTGCASNRTAVDQRIPAPAPVEEFTFQEGDVVKISFPGAPNLDSTQTVRRDGKITLAMVGELAITGRTPKELEQELLGLYAPQLVSKEVSVMVVSSSYPVFVSGAVLRPGKILADRPLTALEAIMEAGGFDTAKADMKAVRVIRQEGGATRNFTIDLKQVLEGVSSEPFFLKRSDIIFVPEKFSWF
jgi:polysaccharide biosynthesis/export protein